MRCFELWSSHGEGTPATEPSPSKHQRGLKVVRCFDERARCLSVPSPRLARGCLETGGGPHTSTLELKLATQPWLPFALQQKLGRLRRLNKTGCNLRCLRSLPEWSSKVVGTASACSSRDSSGICFCLRPCGSVLPGVPSMSALVERPLLQARSRAIFDTKPLFAGTGRQC